MSTSLHILPSVHRLLAREKCTTFECLQSDDLGKILSKEGDGTEVRRWSIIDESGAEQIFFLKRRGREPALRLLTSLLYFRRPHSGPCREMQAVTALRAAGFAAMEPIAWGERMNAGIPREGFLLVRGIPGQSAAEVFDASPSGRRRQFITQMGTLVGRLHAHGFFNPVRFKDLILSKLGDNEFKLTLIDRESSKPWPRSFSIKVAINSLARATRRILRDGHHIDTTESIAFLRAYGSELKAICPISTRELTKAVVRQFRKEMAGDKRAKKLTGPSV